jgi:ribosomal protein L30
MPSSSKPKAEKKLDEQNEETRTATAGDEDPSKPTHFKITLYRSAIGLPKRYKDTLESLGIRRRGQTVFQSHSGSVAGKILRLKEIVKVENVPSNEVKTKSQMRQERRVVRGYYVKQKFQGNANSDSSTSWMDGI